jgi:hypothetical protein
LRRPRRHISGKLFACSLRLPQYDLVLEPYCFGADGWAASERHCLMKAFFVLPSDRYMALWARQSCLHSLPLLLAASATPPKTAILKPAITQSGPSMTVALSWLNLCFCATPFSSFARMCWTAVPFRLKRFMSRPVPLPHRSARPWARRHTPWHPEAPESRAIGGSLAAWSGPAP